MSKKQQLRGKRLLRVRSKLHGTENKPRLCIIKSNCHLYAHLINDDKGETIASVSTNSKEFRNTEFNRKNKVSARKIGEKIAEKAIEYGVKEAIFDRGWAKYHGILAELADGARGAGLKI